MNKGLAAAFLAVALRAQSLDIYSEFLRVDPFGRVVATDAGVARREILSPAVARNGFASFHIVVSVPPKESYFLYVATNPLDACRVSLYREHFVETSRGWIPDPLMEVERLPDFGTMPDPDEHVAGQTTRSYLLDLWIPPDADVSRFRLEVQLKVADWTVRPLELRVLPVRLPNLPAPSTIVLPAVDSPADAAALAVFADALSGRRPSTESHPLTLRGIIRRNAVQDASLFASLSPEALIRRALELFQENSRFSPRLFGAEWYLRLRDFLYMNK